MKAILTILVSAVITLGLRAFPFLVYRGDRQMPQMLKDLGNVLPAAIMAVLVVYCLKDVTTAFADTGLWQVIAALATGTCYKCSHNTFGASCWEPQCYMLLLQPANLNTWTNYD